MNWTPIVPAPGTDPWALAEECNALYECPKDSSGKRLGPLVPYAGKDKQGRNLVGDVYFNFARIEEQTAAADYFASLLARQVLANEHTSKATTIVGVPDGGRSLGQLLARYTKQRFIYPLKVPKPAAPGAVKEEFELVFKRLAPEKGELLLVCDDVNNNFENTDTALNEIGKTGAIVVGLCSALNRSPTIGAVYVPKAGTFANKALPVVTVIRKPLLEYEQDDPAVAADFSAGNIEREVKKNWARLKAIMSDARAKAT